MESSSAASDEALRALLSVNPEAEADEVYEVDESEAGVDSSRE